MSSSLKSLAARYGWPVVLAGCIFTLESALNIVKTLLDVLT